MARGRAMLTEMARKNVAEQLPAKTAKRKGGARFVEMARKKGDGPQHGKGAQTSDGEKRAVKPDGKNVAVKVAPTSVAEKHGVMNGVEKPIVKGVVTNAAVKAAPMIAGAMLTGTVGEMSVAQNGAAKDVMPIATDGGINVVQNAAIKSDVTPTAKGAVINGVMIAIAIDGITIHALGNTVTDRAALTVTTAPDTVASSITRAMIRSVG